MPDLEQDSRDMLPYLALANQGWVFGDNNGDRDKLSTVELGEWHALGSSSALSQGWATWTAF